MGVERVDYSSEDEFQQALQQEEYQEMEARAKAEAEAQGQAEAEAAAQIAEEANQSENY